MPNYGNLGFLAPAPPRISREEDSSHISWTTSLAQNMLSPNAGSSHKSSMKRNSYHNAFGCEVSDDDEEPPTKRKGRPPGSKNKPKYQPIVVSRDREPFLKTNILEISAGQDVIQVLIKFACRINSGITVLSGIGLVSHTSLCLPLSQPQPLILNGSYSLLALNGTVLVGSATRVDNKGNSTQVILPSRTSISVSIAGIQGNVCGGIVAGKLIAASTVTVVATAFSNPCMYELVGEVKTNHGVDPNRALSSSGSGVGYGSLQARCPSSMRMMAAAASNFNVANPVLPINNQIPDELKIMQWGQPLSPLTRKE